MKKNKLIKRGILLLLALLMIISIIMIYQKMNGKPNFESIEEMQKNINGVYRRNELEHYYYISYPKLFRIIPTDEIDVVQEWKIESIDPNTGFLYVQFLGDNLGAEKSQSIDTMIIRQNGQFLDPNGKRGWFQQKSDYQRSNNTIMNLRTPTPDPTKRP